MCSNHQSSIISLSESEGDKKALEEMRALLKKQTGVRAEITKSKILELETQIKAEKKMKSSLESSRKSFIKNLKGIVNNSGPSAVLSLNNDDMTSLVLNGGYAEAVDEFIDQSEKIAKVAQASFIETEVIQTPNFIIDMMKKAATKRIFDDLVLPKVTAGVTNAMIGMSLGEPLSQSMSSLAQSLEQAEGRQLTEINTEISMYGRGITASIAEAAGLNFYLYTGPEDGITRDFCSALVNKVVSDKQLSQLNNRQGLSVKTSLGGYNCRHSLSPVSEGFIQAAKLKKATKKDISDANAGARK
tara:strand:+ start:10610 stop:11512 length:903 start_codon:yes stop_codon:yes gene_type:complete